MAESLPCEALGILCYLWRRGTWGWPQRGSGGRRLPGNFRAWPGAEKGQETPVREGQTEMSAFARFPRQCGGGRSGAQLWSRIQHSGGAVRALQVERGNVGKCFGLGAGWRGCICGFQ